MKILHTSDLHLGKCLLEESLFEDQKDMLNQIVSIIENEHIDVTIIAGDIYDKSIPSSDAIHLFDDFLNKLSKLDTQVIIISGNHDSNDRLSFGSQLFNKLNIHIDAIYEGKMKKYSFDEVNIYSLSFIKPFHLKKFMEIEEYEKVNNVTEMMKWILNQEQIDKTKKNILVAHQFVINDGVPLELSESESTTSIGTLDSIPYHLLKDFDYVALGHIHKPQKVGRNTIRYSGTPLKYSFSEVNNQNSIVIYDTMDNSITLKEINPLRKLRVIRGKFDDIMNMIPSKDLIRVELEDEIVNISPMDEIRKIFPNALSLGFINKNKLGSNIIDSDGITLKGGPLSLFKEFYLKQNGLELNSDEEKYIQSLIDNIEGN